MKLPKGLKLPPGARSLGINLAVLGIDPKPQPDAKPGSYRIAIPGWHPPTLNVLMRGERRERIRLGKQCRSMVAAYCSIAGVPEAKGRRRVTLELTLGPRQRWCDVDAHWKALLDALVDAGMIRDDSPRWCETRLSLDGSRAAERATLIVLEEVPDLADSPGGRKGRAG